MLRKKYTYLETSGEIRAGDKELVCRKIMVYKALLLDKITQGDYVNENTNNKREQERCMDTSIFISGAEQDNP